MPLNTFDWFYACCIYKALTRCSRVWHFECFESFWEATVWLILDLNLKKHKNFSSNIFDMKCCEVFIYKIIYYCYTKNSYLLLRDVSKMTSNKQFVFCMQWTLIWSVTYHNAANQNL